MAVEIRHTWELSALLRRRLRELLDRAFDGDFADSDFDHALGGLHVLVSSADGDVAAHAAVVARSMVVDAESFRVGYVEAVAVDPSRRRQGLGHQVMEACERIVVGAYDFGALSASAAGEPLYRARGWRPWEGELGALTPEGPIPTPDDRGGVHVFGTVARLDGRLMCDWRAGDLW